MCWRTWFRRFMPAGQRPPLAIIAIRGSLTLFAEEKRLTRWIIRLDALAVALG